MPAQQAEIAERLKNLHISRGQVKSALTRFLTFIQSESSRISSQLDARTSKIQQSFDEFNVIQNEIEIITNMNEAEVKQREVFENDYFNAMGLVHTIKQREKHRTVADISSTNNRIKLPSVSLPKFNGKFSDWLSFEKSFKQLLQTHDDLTEMEKFLYLQSCLEGPASAAVESIEFDENCYQEAWKVLEGKFKNSKLITDLEIRNILQIKKLSDKSYDSFQELLDNSFNSIRKLKSITNDKELADSLIIYLVSSKLDEDSKQLWEQSLSKSRLPNLKEFEDFMSKQAQSLNATPNYNFKPKTKQAPYHANFKGQKSKDTVQSNAGVSGKEQCAVCKADHRIFYCENFLSKSVQDRNSFIRENKMCINCLSSGHLYKDCKFSSCKICNKKHNTLLHIAPAKPEDNSSSLHCNSKSNPKTIVMLATAKVYLIGKNNQRILARALLDGGSHINLVTEEMFQSLGLKRRHCSHSVDGLGSNKVKTNGLACCELKSLHSDFSETTDFIIMSKIANNLPAMSLDKSNWSHLNHLKLADDDYNKSESIDVLLGADIFYKIIEASKIEGSVGHPTARQTKLGWIVVGAISNSKTLNVISNTVTCFHSSLGLESLMKRFWEIEDIPKEDNESNSSENEFCMQHFKETHQRDSEGRFIVKLPMKTSENNFGDTLTMAKKRYSYLEKRLKSNSKFSEMYCDFIKEYLELNHMEIITCPESNPTSEYFLPHHGVLKENSLTTKLRVVFDGSAHVNGHPSLNDVLCNGPKLQEDLLWIILKFRFNKIAIISDIEKMFRQIVLHRDDRNLQKILFRFSPNSPLTFIRLSTVTYGQTSSTFWAVKCLTTLAEENKTKFPKASQMLSKNFYVDDGIMGAESLEDAIELFNELNELLGLGCFNLRKWSSNSSEFLKQIQQSPIAKQTDLFINPEKITKVLGLNWDTISDTLSVPPELKLSPKINKRSILSEMSQFFDPFGIISPFVLRAKLIMQQLWELKIAWDDELPDDICAAWVQFRDDSRYLEQLKIPRYIPIDSRFIELHAFCDASEKAYGYCIYIRSIDHISNTSFVSLILSKTRIAPIKQLTIPKLELCAAHLMATGINSLYERIKCNRIFAWSDSQIVLAWIKKKPSELKIFVANRIRFIQSIGCIDSWKYIQTKNNPADICSRGMRVRDLLVSNKWWYGPDFLKETCSETLIHDDFNESDLADLIELNEASVLSALTENKFDLIHRFSSLFKLLCVTSRILRFSFNTKMEKSLRKVGSLSADEIQISLKLLIQVSQRTFFSPEIKALKSCKSISNNKLLTLSPFLDDDQIMRVGGRIQSSIVPFSEKHPIILHSQCHLAYLIVVDCHLKYLHAPPSVMLPSIRQKYWIIGGKKLIKSVYRKCVPCIKELAKPKPQIMGNLPSYRVQAFRPFLHTGVDYGGPFTIRLSKGRGKVCTKAYLALFVCFSTRAVHLEAVSDLTSEAFIACLGRFISRRGVPNTIFSDNGRNFYAASKHLSEMYSMLNNEEHSINKFMLENKISWKFSPAYSPHFGGIWEAGIKSAKSYLKLSLKDVILTFEEICTLFTQIESILNSRPLVPLGDDANDFEVLTPGHFLIGTALTNLPDIEEPFQMSFNSRWRLVQQRVGSFWKQWHKNYLQELQKRVKWKRPIEDVKLHDMVLIKNNNFPHKWNLGRICELFPGNDGHVRVLSIETKKGIVKRALNQVVRLPVECSQGGENV